LLPVQAGVRPVFTASGARFCWNVQRREFALRFRTLRVRRASFDRGRVNTILKK
jgi:hypothetical protein